MSKFDQVPIAMYCPQCKMGLPPRANYCTFCGWVLTQARSDTFNRQFRHSSELNTKKDQSLRRRKSVLIYTISALFLILVSIISLLYYIGNSPFSLFSSRVPPPKVNSNVTPKETPLFADNFSNDAHGWNLQSSSGMYRVTLGKGVLGLQVERHNILWELLPGERTFSNFTLTVNADLIQGDQNNGYGVYIRGTSNRETDLATYYRFELYGDGSYAIFKGTSDSHGNLIVTKMVNYTLNSAINRMGEVNHIIIIANGAFLSFMLNGQLLSTLKDTSFSSGVIALFVSNLPEAKLGAQAQFSQFAIYPKI
jgi:3-keto-disaccharide hydrolase